MERTINLIGIGTDGDRSLTQEAKQLIGESTVLIGAKRMLKSTKKYQKENVLRYEKYRPEEVLHILETVPDWKISLLFSGDPGCYSGAEKMTEELCRAGWRVRICPGIASVIAMAARCQVPWERAAFVSLHGTDQNVIHAISTHEHTFILLGGMMTAEIFLEKMAWYGLDDLKAAAGRNLSYEDEVFYSGAVRDMTPEMLSGLTVLWVHHPEYDARVGRHLEDGELIRGSVPMTKSSVRAMAIAALRLQEDSVVYDIGAGTGSVAVETAMQGGGIRVYAIERNPEGVRLVQENKRRWRTDNVTVVEGDAPEALHDLPAPTHVFIGGSGGRLREMIDVCLSKSPNARIVVTAVSLETVQEMAGLLQEERWKETDVIQIQTAYSRKLGDYHMMMGQNPVWMAVLQGGGEDSDE